MKLRSLIILSFNLAGCTSMGQNITWSRVPLSQIKNECVSMHSAWGCSRFSIDTVTRQPNKSFCQVFTPTREEVEQIAKDKGFKDVDVFEMVILGHEIRHCFEGQFHK